MPLTTGREGESQAPSIGGSSAVSSEDNKRRRGTRTTPWRNSNRCIVEMVSALNDVLLLIKPTNLFRVPFRTEGDLVVSQGPLHTPILRLIRGAGEQTLGHVSVRLVSRLAASSLLSPLKRCPSEK